MIIKQSPLEKIIDNAMVEYAAYTVMKQLRTKDKILQDAVKKINELFKIKSP